MGSSPAGGDCVATANVLLLRRTMEMQLESASTTNELNHKHLQQYTLDRTNIPHRLCTERHRGEGEEWIQLMISPKDTAGMRHGTSIIIKDDYV